MSHSDRIDNDTSRKKKKDSSWGSVLFFKRIIVIFIGLLIFSLAIGCLSLEKVNNSLADELNQLRSDLETIQIELNTVNANATAAASRVSEAEPTPEPSLQPTAANVSFSYQTMYPDLCCEPQTPVKPPAKTLYLTFDDGPSANTTKVLDILKKYNIKATFFVVGNESAQGAELMKRIVAEGHSIGVHTYTHVYESIYASVDAYLDDFKKEYDLIYKTTGVKPTIFRFPGGSINSYDRQIYQQLIAEMTRRGFAYYDWNISSGDGSETTTAAAFKKNILNNAANADPGIVLMHDAASKKATIGILEEVIVELINRGYNFAPLTNEVMPVTFLYLH